MPKKRIPRAEFHGIILNFVGCGKFGTAHKVESPYIFLKSGISTKLQLNYIFFKAEILFLGSNSDFPFFGEPTKSKNIPWNSTRGIRFLGTNLIKKSDSLINGTAVKLEVRVFRHCRSK